MIYAKIIHWISERAYFFLLSKIIIVYVKSGHFHNNEMDNAWIVADYIIFIEDIRSGLLLNSCWLHEEW